MISFTKRSQVLLGAGVMALAALSIGTARYAVGSDHAGTIATAQTNPKTDLSDLHIFPSPTDANNIVLSMSVHPLIPAGTSTNSTVANFDPNVLYQFKIDVTGDYVEDLVIQARFTGSGSNQRVFISGPVKPATTGATTTFQAPYSVGGFLNKTFSPTPGMRVFAGLRSDPFFIDLDQLFAILPDRADPLQPAGMPKTPPGQANVPKATTFRAPGVAKDFLANYNVMALVVELPKSRIGNGKINVWETTSSLAPPTA